MKEIKFSEDSRYAFVAGRIKSKEKELLKKEDWENLLNKEDEKDFLNYLKNTAYQKFEDKEIPKIFFNAEIENYKFFKEYILDDWVLSAVLFDYDLHNIKLYLKGEILKKDFSLYFSCFSAIPINILKNIWQIKIERGYLKEIKEILKSALLFFEKEKNLTLLEFFLDKNLFSLIYQYAQKGDFLRVYFQEKSTQKNILFLLRVKRKGIDLGKKDLTFYLLPFSYFDADFYYQILSLEFLKISELFKASDYYPIVKEGIAEYFRTGDFIFLETAFKKRLLSLTSLTKYLIFGYELLCAYYWLKESEIDNLKKIYYLKIKEKLPKEWVKALILTI
jgi:vacuolar-type H+-ATPase subunit C/Vma6